MEVASILQHIKPSDSFDILSRRLMKDPNPEVRKATLRSLAKIRPPHLIPDVVHMLNDTTVRNEIRQALAGYGAEIIPHLQYVLDNPLTSVDAKKIVLMILADINSRNAIELLFAHAVGPNLGLRFAAIKALNRLRKRQDLPLQRASLESLLNQEITAVELELERSRMFSPKHGGLMEAVLSQRLMWARERVFRSLALLYEPKSIYSAYRAIIGKDRRKADSAVEYLDTILVPEHRNRIIPMLESRRADRVAPDAASRRAILFAYLGARDQLPAAALIADLNQSELELWKTEISEALQIFNDLPLVEETLNWRYTDMLPETLQRKLTTIQKLEILGRVDMFSELGPNELLLLANQCVEAEFDEDDVIFSEGETARDIYVLASGAVELTRNGGPNAELKEGQSFGTLSVLGDQPRFFTAKALERSLCLKIERETFWEILEDYPAICQGIFKMMAARFGSMIGPN